MKNVRQGGLEGGSLSGGGDSHLAMTIWTLKVWAFWTFLLHVSVNPKPQNMCENGITFKDSRAATRVGKPAHDQVGASRIPNCTITTVGCRSFKAHEVFLFGHSTLKVQAWRLRKSGIRCWRSLRGTVYIINGPSRQDPYKMRPPKFSGHPLPIAVGKAEN